MLDNMSRGRLDAGFGRAFLPKEFEVYGVPMEQSRPRFEEAIGMIRRLWTEERVSQKGKFWNLDDVRLMPRVVQKRIRRCGSRRSAPRSRSSTRRRTGST